MAIFLVLAPTMNLLDNFLEIGNFTVTSVADPGFLEGGLLVREILEATPTLGQNNAHFDRF